MLNLVLLIAAAAAAQSAPATERHCGWLHNPTPGNWWLVDRDGEWVLSTQGRQGVPGMETLVDMTTRGWVRTNGNYGHGCACITMTTDRRTRRVIRVTSGNPLPPRQCRADPRLPRP